MGVEVVVGGADVDEVAAVRTLFDEWDGVFSRFLPDSELSLVNRFPRELVVVSPLFARALRTALAAADATDGLVDLTLGAAVEAAGYDRDFSLLEADERPPGAAARGAWRRVRLAGRILRRPPTTRLDLNGVVKSLAVDDALGVLSGDGFVSAGGDVASRGPVEVGLPADGSVRLDGGGLATSSTTRRRWFRGGTPQHHLIDPSTGRPSTSLWTDVTVAAGTCLAADVAAKAALLLSERGPDWLDERGLPGRFIAPGRVLENRSWRSRVRAKAVA